MAGVKGRSGRRKSTLKTVKSTREAIYRNLPLSVKVALDAMQEAMLGDGRPDWKTRASMAVFMIEQGIGKAKQSVQLGVDSPFALLAQKIQIAAGNNDGFRVIPPAVLPSGEEYIEDDAEEDHGSET